jgi:predicted amidophosphoribosyltransferase
VPAVFAYDGDGRRLVAALKYRNGRSVVPVAAAALAQLARPHRVEAVTWAPTSHTHRHHRGYDQAEVLARAVARGLNVPVRRLLARGPGPPQTGRSRAERLAAPPAFSALGVVPTTVLLIDDVVTTGATLAAARAVLEAAGARQVWCLALAATPPPGRCEGPVLLAATGP